MAAVVAPSIGPAIVVVLGASIPILALALGGMGLLLARVIAPPPLRKLTRAQHFALTVLLLIVLFLLVTGGFPFPPFDKPMGMGMATMAGIGLGFSGLVAVEFFAGRWMSAVKAFWKGE